MADMVPSVSFFLRFFPFLGLDPDPTWTKVGSRCISDRSIFLKKVIDTILSCLDGEHDDEVYSRSKMDKAISFWLLDQNTVYCSL